MKTCDRDKEHDWTPIYATGYINPIKYYCWRCGAEQPASPLWQRRPTMRYR